MSEVATKTAETTDAIVLKDSTIAMSGKFAEHIKFEESNLTLPKDLARSLMVEALGEDATANYEKAKVLVATEMLPGLAHAVGTASIPYFKENKAADIVSVTLPFGKDNLAITVQRKAEMGFGDNEKTVKWGHTTAKVLTGGLGNNTGELKKVRQTIAQMGALELAK